MTSRIKKNSFYFAGVRQWIAYIFIAIFSMQVLPVKEIGKILFKGQITEEEVHGYSHAGGDDNVKLKKEGDPFDRYFFVSQQDARIAFLSHKIHIAIHKAQQLPPYFIPDILTPPPNC